MEKNQFCIAKHKNYNTEEILMLLNVSQKTAQNKDKCQFSVMFVIHISWHPIVELVPAAYVREPSF